jgi:hypothetical protein
MEQIQDRACLAKVTNALNQHWQKRNASKKNCVTNNSQNGHLLPAGQSSAAGG